MDEGLKRVGNVVKKGPLKENFNNFKSKMKINHFKIIALSKIIQKY